MSESVRRPLPLPEAWKDQGIDYSRPVKDVTNAHIRSVDQHGVLMRYKRRRLVYPIVGSLATLGITGLIIWFMAPRLWFQPEYRTLSNILLFGASAFMLVWAIWILGHVAVVVRNGSRKDRFVALTPMGIYHNGGGWTAFFPWDELTSIRAMANYGSKTAPTQRVHLHPRDQDKLFVEDKRRIKWPKIDRKAPGNREIHAGELAVVDVAMPYWGLRFYHENPEHRRELGTEAGLRRFQEGDFPAEEESGS